MLPTGTFDQYCYPLPPICTANLCLPTIDSQPELQTGLAGHQLPIRTIS